MFVAREIKQKLWRIFLWTHSINMADIMIWGGNIHFPIFPKFKSVYILQTILLSPIPMPCLLVILVPIASISSRIYMLQLSKDLTIVDPSLAPACLTQSVQTFTIQQQQTMQSGLS